MYCLSKICCCCLQSNAQLKSLKKVTHFSTTEIDFIKVLIGAFLEPDHVLSICEDCAKQVKEVHSFCQNVIKNNKILIKYLQKLRTSGSDFGHVQVQINDMTYSRDPEILIYKKFRKIKNIYTAENNVADEALEIKIEDDQECRQELSGNEGDTTTYKTSLEKNCQYENEINIREKEFKIEIYDDFNEVIGENEELTLGEDEPTIEVSGARACETSEEEEMEEMNEELIEENEIIPVNSKQRKNKNFEEKAFSRKSTLTKPMLIHTRKRPYKCKNCGKSFIRKKFLIGHMLVHKKPHNCKTCGKSFARKYTLTSHMFIHTDEKPHKCEICRKSFAYKTNLTTHMIVHTGERLHKCEICEKSFFFKATLTHHMVVHTGEKPHSCEICVKSFARKKNLTAHMLTHTDETPHNCEICGKFFARKNYLIKHMITHTCEKLHKCKTCGKSFAQKNYLTKHITRHTRENPHTCQTCRKSFACKKSLIDHMLTHIGKKSQKNKNYKRYFFRKKSNRSYVNTH